MQDSPAPAGQRSNGAVLVDSTKRPRRLFLTALVLATVLASCESPESIHGTGVMVEPPSGWVDYCYRHPEDGGCRNEP